MEGFSKYFLFQFLDGQNLDTLDLYDSSLEDFPPPKVFESCKNYPAIGVETQRSESVWNPVKVDEEISTKVLVDGH
jgi:hypothetical protein